MQNIFETHAHYDDDAFDGDRDELIREFPENGIAKVVNIGANISTSKATVELTKKYDFFYGAVGVHPSDIREMEEPGSIELIEKLAVENEKIVAIGEIGLDYHYEDTDEVLQKKWFVNQMELAKRLGLPIVVHSRDAAKDTMDIMTAEKAGDIGGVVHCFSYSKEVAKIFLDMGFYIGIGGVVTFKNGKKLKEVVEYAPLDRIVLETDAPYLAPEPYRGKRNSSLYIPHAANVIADIKGVSLEELYKITYDNAMKLYRL
ncbi:MAG: TatD family deoxyribonuclease [Lachnospiraceae bacterium]|nr:TatD family deoxyribonuclease [Lachnospiraceae bacterium]